MVTLTRKQREVAEREEKILSIARDVLLREGLEALSMDRLATQMQYAKGTLYNHFPNKEEIVLALACQAMEARVRLFESAAAASPMSRERMMAIGCATEKYSDECREEFMIEQLIRNPAVWEKASPNRQNFIRKCESTCMGIVSGIVRHAIASGDLELPKNFSPEQLVFGFWSLTYGSTSIAVSSPSLADLGIANVHQTVRFHCWTMLNGFQWKPLLTYEEYDSLMGTLLNRI